MTGPYPPWTVTPKGDERSSCPHFSSSNWAAIIREGSLTHPPPAGSLLCLSSTPLSLILGQVEESHCSLMFQLFFFIVLSSFVSHALLLFFLPEASGKVCFLLFHLKQGSWLCCHKELCELPLCCNSKSRKSNRSFQCVCLVLSYNTTNIYLLLQYDPF